MVDLDVAQQWVSVDSSGLLLGERFRGTLDQLQRYLSAGLHDVRPSFAASGERSVWLDERSRSVQCYMLVMQIPWGTYRWIPDPGGR